MTAPKKATDAELIAAYAELDNVHKVGKRFGMHGSSVHERLTKLGVMQPKNIFTEGEKERLRADYAAFRASGKVTDLAYEMGRTVQFLSRQARALASPTLAIRRSGSANGSTCPSRPPGF